MVRWAEVDGHLAAQAWASMEQHKHKVLATLRSDGSPRVSGTEVELLDGDLWCGSMLGALKARDLLRDPRFALHGPALDATLATPDVKLAGMAVAATDEQMKAFLAVHGDHIPPDPFHLFRLDITELVCTTVEGDQLVVTSWHPERGVDVRRR